MAAAALRGRPEAARAVAGRVAALLIGLIAILSVVDLVLTATLVHPSLSAAQLSLVADLVDPLLGVLLLAFISAATTFFAWLYRTTKVTPALDAGDPDHGAAASVGWWFVPIANLFMPYLIVARLYRRLDLPARPARGWVPLLWWLSFVGSSVIGNVAVDGIETAISAAQLSNAMVLYGVSTVLDVVAAVAVIWLIFEMERLKGLRAAGNTDAYQHGC